MKQVLVDSSAWVEALRRDGDPRIRTIVSELTREGRAVFCDLVRLELWNGVRGREEKKLLSELERELRVAETSEAVWGEARELARRCRASGVTVPATDLLIAACARVHGLELLHRDRHFDTIEEAS